MTKFFIRYDDNGGLGAYAGIKEFATADLGGKVFDRTDDVLAAIAALKASEEPYHHYLAKQLETAEGRLTHFKLAAVGAAVNREDYTFWREMHTAYEPHKDVGYIDEFIAERVGPVEDVETETEAMLVILHDAWARREDPEAMIGA